MIRATPSYFGKQIPRRKWPDLVTNLRSTPVTQRAVLNKWTFKRGREKRKWAITAIDRGSPRRQVRSGPGLCQPVVEALKCCEPHLSQVNVAVYLKVSSSLACLLLRFVAGLKKAVFLRPAPSLHAGRPLFSPHSGPSRMNSHMVKP